jgi:hypothetical protein
METVNRRLFTKSPGGDIVRQGSMCVYARAHTQTNNTHAHTHTHTGATGKDCESALVWDEADAQAFSDIVTQGSP